MELDIFNKIKKYWNKAFGSSENKPDEKFTDATEEKSVRTSEFLCKLNLDPVMSEINKHYSVKEGEEKYPRRAMIKTMIFKKIKQIKYYTEIAGYLKSNPIDAIELGFNQDQDGHVIVPDHETLRHFEKIRLGNQGMNSIMTVFSTKIVEAGDKLNLTIGKNTGTDSTPIEVPNDPAGTYNGHYKKKMVKAHITSDYDHNLPLAKKVCGGTEDDDKYFEEMLQQTSISAKKNMEKTWFDGGYNSNKNIALAHVIFGLTPHYHIDANWRQNVKYAHIFNGKVYEYTPEKEINYLYRKRWKEPDYKKDASFEYMMQFLVKKGIYEPIAMHFRNARIQEYEECPDGVLDVYHTRNCSEGINSYMKNYLGLETHINGKGMKNIDLHVTECCIAILAAALTRLQNGIIKNISSVAYLI
jgi:Transposase DDE domain